MENIKYQELIIELAHILATKNIEAATVRQALHLLCDGFDFDCSVLYKIDHFNNLCLTEICGNNKTAAQPQIPISDLLPELRRILTQNAVLEFDTTTLPCAEHTQLATLFGAKTAMVNCVSDENGHIYGFVALCNIDKLLPIDEFLQKNIKAALSMICSHCATEMYRNSLTAAQGSLESILDNTGIDIYVNDFFTHDILYVNKSMAAPYGGQAQFTNRKCWQVLFPGQIGPCEFCPQKKLIDENGSPSKIYTWDYQRAFDGSWFRVFSSAFRWTDGRLAHVVSSADITDNKRNEELVKFMANYDSLTNLPNRRMLVNDCEMRTNKSIEKSAYVLFFDIDGFKKINDTFGHDAGDEFLVKLGKFFSNIPMLKDNIYRNGGDEFVALLGDNVTEDNVRNLARFIHTRFETPWMLKNGEAICNASIGVAAFPSDGKTSEELLYKADKAMYEAKKSGGGTICFASGNNI